MSKKIVADMEECRRIAARYEKFGITPLTVKEMVELGEDDRLDERTRFIGCRMCLSKAFGVEELISVADVAHVLGESVETVMKMMRENGMTPITVTTAPWLEKFMQ